MGYFMFICLTCDISMSQTFELEMLHWVRKCIYTDINMHIFMYMQYIVHETTLELQQSR